MPTAKAAANIQYDILNKEDGAARDSNQNRLSRGPSDGVHFTIGVGQPSCIRQYLGKIAYLISTNAAASCLWIFRSLTTLVGLQNNTYAEETIQALKLPGIFTYLMKRKP